MYKCSLLAHEQHFNKHIKSSQWEWKEQMNMMNQNGDPIRHIQNSSNELDMLNELKESDTNQLIKHKS